MIDSTLISALAALTAGRILSVDDAVVRRWDERSDAMKRRIGRAPIGTLLAVTALESELFPATRNARDVRLGGAAVFNLWEDNPAQFPLA